MILKLPEFERLPAAVAIDLDGTLLNSRTEVSERNLKALEACTGWGVPVIIATARAARIFNRIFPDGFADKCSYVCLNGALVKANRPLSGSFFEFFAGDTAQEIVKLILEFDPNAAITVETDGHDFGTNWEVDYSALWQRNAARPENVLSLEKAVDQPCCKMLVSGHDLVLLAERLAERFGSAISVVGARIYSSSLNITPAAATKPNALRRLLSPHGISLNDVLAIGDDLPDLDMLRLCGLPVAMANAFPEVKAVCRYHTASNDDDGVALVLETMLENAS